MLRSVVGVSGTLLALGAAVALVPQRGRASDVDPVLVVNGPKRPVPVTLAGGTGSANVNVVNQPTVNLSPDSSVGLAPGTLVGVRNKDGLEAVQSNVGVGMNDGAPGAEVVAFSVPAGKRFVLEDVSGVIHLPGGQKLINAAVVTSSSEMYTPVTFAGTASNGQDVFLIGRAARAFADPETDVKVGAQRNDTTGIATGAMTIAGYLVDL
jgi:hypothetical protein